jgi:tetratricopeptide (TPR) repeat protein
MYAALINSIKLKYGECGFDSVKWDVISDLLRAAPVLRMQLPSVLRLYRARKNINISKEDINKITPFTYPSKTLCTENGRANLIGYPVFYCSDSVATSIFECRPEIGDIFYVSEWLVNGDSSATISFNASEKSICLSALSPVLDFIKKNIDNRLDAAWHKLFIDGEVGRYDIFCKECYPYLSSALYSHILINECNVDLIIYPSIAYRQNSVNYMVNPNFVDNSFVCERVFKLKITGDGASVMASRLVSIGNYCDGLISWDEPNESDFKYLNSVFIYEGEVVKARMLGKNEGDHDSLLVSRIDEAFIKSALISISSSEICLAVSFFQKAECLIRAGDFAEAIEKLDSALDIINVVPLFYRRRGFCYLSVNKYDDAIRDYTSAKNYIYAHKKEEDYNSILVKIYNERGTAYQYAKKYDKAIVDFNLAISLDPNDHIPKINLGNCYFSMSKYSEAISVYRSVKVEECQDNKKVLAEIDEAIARAENMIQANGKI